MLSIRTICKLTAVALLLASHHAFAEEIARWEFDTAEIGWVPNDQTSLSVADGVLTFKSSGNDPSATVSVAGRAGYHKLNVQVRLRGSTEMQLFWTTEAAPNTSEKNSVRGEVRGRGNKFQTMQVFFATDSPVTSLRIDPINRKGRIEIESIVLTDDSPKQPQATPVGSIKSLDGFDVELLYSVPGDEFGSWVCMTPDQKGRLIVSDQYGKLYRVTPPAIGSDAKIQIEPINVDVGMAQGLLCAFDSLYVNVNGTDRERQGLFRVTDTDDDDQYDTVEWIRKLDGGAEHGPHAVILSPDGKSLYVCAGNHTDPTEFSSSRVPTNYDEDQLLPRMWDAGGHAVGKVAPGGWIANVSPDGKDWEMVANGFRNEYDIAFNADGELFTYDADMEWDVGTPWYRPTRVNHVTSGAEFGWRSGTGKWPVWYPDSLGSVIDIGQGSPTGIVFGTGANFPAKYQRSLFISDWSYGVVYAVHLTPSGSTYTGEAERFLSAAPLPVTDIVVNPADGAMYFTIGGRKTQSGLYRVTYNGRESTGPAVLKTAYGTDDRALRRKLETLHSAEAKDAIATAWPYLGHPDQHIRFAARIAIEHQPVAAWADRALAESTNADSSITALLALARSGNESHQIPLLEALGRLDANDLTESQMLAALRVVGLSFIRLGAPDGEMARDTAAVLNELYPSDSVRMNRELCALLVYLQHPDAASKTIALLDAATTQEEQLHYALCLRVLKEGWSQELRSKYFDWFVTSASMRGGNSFGGFLKNIRDEAVANLTKEESIALKEVLDRKPEPSEPVIEAASRPLVNEWKVNELLSEVEAGLHGRNYQNGRKMFIITACYKCHRFAGDGGIVGPDLTAVGRRYNALTILESLIEPSKVVSDQYQASIFVMDSGLQVIGRVVNLNADKVMVSENMLDPGKLTTIIRDQIEEQLPSKVSMMPNGLLNNLTRDEILDLIAYMQSGGDNKAEVFAAVPSQMPTFTERGHTTDSLQTVRQRITDGKAVLFDVREQNEWDAGHLKDAKLVPLSMVRSGKIPAELARSFPKDKPIYLHCRSGGRVLMFYKTLQNQGYDIRPLSTGYAGLVEKGFPKAE
jgi:putative heme-binding domain-containing protein